MIEPAAVVETTAGGQEGRGFDLGFFAAHRHARVDDDLGGPVQRVFDRDDDPVGVEVAIL
ncbi:hypothetical protein [Desulfofustis glycolicus]|uniref:hypothetical protein n=1 Tax=Desulfofustis glycolicus TaxID=51195 RepID=UPI00116118ED|nr:hypothetical protein [Desulfofustis glycolicus]